jgi:hypothetical protein
MLAIFNASATRMQQMHGENEKRCISLSLVSFMSNLYISAVSEHEESMHSQVNSIR